MLEQPGDPGVRNIPKQTWKHTNRYQPVTLGPVTSVTRPASYAHSRAPSGAKDWPSWSGGFDRPGPGQLPKTSPKRLTKTPSAEVEPKELATYDERNVMERCCSKIVIVYCNTCMIILHSVHFRTEDNYFTDFTSACSVNRQSCTCLLYTSPSPRDA